MIKKTKICPECQLVSTSYRYGINGVKFIVSPIYDKKQTTNIEHRLKNCIEKSVAPLTKTTIGSKLTEDYVDLTAGKED